MDYRIQFTIFREKLRSKGSKWFKGGNKSFAQHRTRRSTGENGWKITVTYKSWNKVITSSFRSRFVWKNTDFSNIFAFFWHVSVYFFDVQNSRSLLRTIIFLHPYFYNFCLQKQILVSCSSSREFNSWEEWFYCIDWSSLISLFFCTQININKNLNFQLLPK